MQNPRRFCLGGPFAEAEDCISAGVNRLTDAIRDLIHVNFRSCLNVLMAHDRLGVLHGSVLLKVSSEGASENLKSAQIPRDAKLIGDWPHLPLEEISGLGREPLCPYSVEVRSLGTSGHLVKCPGRLVARPRCKGGCAAELEFERGCLLFSPSLHIATLRTPCRR